VLQNKGEKTLFYAFLFDVCPDCLCNDFNKPPIIQDIGILASRDPVAVEQASYDTICAEGGDKFADLYPEHDSQICMEYAQSIGLGTREYSIMEV
jgi:uncharacterized Fe-S center protein